MMFTLFTGTDNIIENYRALRLNLENLTLPKLEVKPPNGKIELL